MAEHGAEGRHLRVHDDDVGRDASLSQRGTLVGHRHGQIVHMVFLQRLGYLNGSRAVGIGLDHAHQPRVGSEEGAVAVQVADHGAEVHLQYGLVYALLQLLTDALKAEATGALE